MSHTVMPSRIFFRSRNFHFYITCPYRYGRFRLDSTESDLTGTFFRPINRTSSSPKSMMTKGFHP